MRQCGCGDDGRVGDAHVMVYFVALLEAAQNADRILHRRLVDQHRLEAALQCGVLLDVFAVLVQRGRADGVQLAPGQQRLEHVAGVQRSLGRARADHGVQLVDEEDHLAVALGDLLQHGLEPLLELAAELGARHQAAHVQGNDALVLQAGGHVAAHDAQRQPLGDGRLADTRLADQHRVVLGAPAEDLDDAADLLVAADDRVEFALARQFGQIAPVFGQRLVGGFRVLAGDALAAADALQGLQDRVAADAGRGQQLLCAIAGFVGQRQEQVLGADIVVVHPVSLALSSLQHALQRPADAWLHGIAVDPRPVVEGNIDLGNELLRVAPKPKHNLRHDAVGLLQQRQKQMFRLNLRVVIGFSLRLSLQQRFLGALRKFVLSHVTRPLS